MKLNHNETLSYPTEYDQTLYASVEQAFNMGAVAVGATIYFGSEQSRRQIEEISAAFERAHELGLGHRAVGLSAQFGVQERRRRLSCFR